jgi:hypothetical protein
MLSLSLVKDHAVTTYAGLIHAFLTSVLEPGECLASHSVRVTHGQRAADAHWL